MNSVTFIRNEVNIQKWAFRYEPDYEFLADSDRTKSHKWRNLP